MSSLQAPTTDVEVRGVRYQIGRFKARDGSFILAQLLTKMLPSAIEGQFQGAGLAKGRSPISEEEFSSIQGHALAVCRRYENGNVPMPIFVRPDTWAVKELEYDVIAVMALTVQALVFNISPFFEGNGLNQILASIPGLGRSLPATQT